ncbi:MAG: DNA-3-methyladenine glycosylase [Acidimicrobiales bacterium]|nr:DNA-3-methyladenine glycosylase [Acidimicrobiales bacterium]MDP6901810.1 DNA-3-methyladenine glycosylase [Acidimicrobiales bacterium]HJL99168.1 DNA-3-methyladenine glycosylase [Acidimicrobiales bacterium]
MTIGATSNNAREALVSYVQPYSFQQLLDHLRPRTTPGVERVEGNIYSRVTVHAGIPRVLQVEDANDGRHLRITTTSQSNDNLTDDLDRLRYLFAVDEDPSFAVAHLSQDPFIGRLVTQRPWVRVPRCWDPFETSIRIIIGQQISVAAATTISGRIAARLGQQVSTGSGLNRIFPSPEILANAELNDMGLTERRKTTLQNFSRAVTDGTIDLRRSEDLDEMEKHWCTLPGIGPWTAQVAAMRVLGHDDAMPSSDLGVLRAVNRLANQDLNTKQLESQANIWRPFRSWAAQHLWQAPEVLGST